MNWLTKRLKKLHRKVFKWWQGEVYKNSSDPKLIYIGLVYRPSAILAHKITDFIKREYRFLIGIAVAVTGVVLTIIL